MLPNDLCLVTDHSTLILKVINNEYRAYEANPWLLKNMLCSRSCEDTNEQETEAYAGIEIVGLVYFPKIYDYFVEFFSFISSEIVSENVAKFRSQ